MKSKLKLKQTSNHPDYIKGLQYHYGMNGVQQSYFKALEYYQLAAKENDLNAINMIKHITIPKKMMFIFLGIVILAVTFGVVTNELWSIFFFPGAFLALYTTQTFNFYWFKPGWAYKWHRTLFFLSYLGFIPLSAIIPYIYGISWFPITLLLVLGVFILGAGVILLIDDPNLNHGLIILSGVVVLGLSITGFSISTSEQKFIIKEIEGGVEITGIRTSDRVLDVPSRLNNQTVISIGENAFSQTLIETITLPDTLLEIKDYAFAYTPYLTQVEYPSNVQLGKGVFMYATALESVILPDQLEVLNEALLMGTYQLRSINLPTSIHTIEKRALAYSGINSIELHSGITRIEDEAFRGTQIQSIILPNTLLHLGEYVFSENRILTSFIFSNQLTSIPIGTFSQTGSLTEFVVPTSITSIEDKAFKDSIELTSITFHDLIEHIGDSAFMNTALTEVEIPPLITQLSSRLFQDNKALERVKLPSNLISIGDSAFKGTSIATIDLPLGLINIGSSAFADNDQLTSINIPTTVETLGSSLFYRNTRLESIIIPEGIQLIGDYFCFECERLTTLELPNSISKIGKYAFYDTNLNIIELPENVIEVGDYAYFSNENNQSITFNDKLERIGSYAFYGHYHVLNLSFPSSLTFIGDGSFGLCNNVESIYIDAPLLDYVGYYAFYQCEKAIIYLNETLDISNWNSGWNPSNIEINRID